MIFNWIRPSHIPYPNVWFRFQAKDLDCDNLVEYIVEDLPEDRFDDAIAFMTTEFLANAPMAKLRNGANNSTYVQDIGRIWKNILQQRMTHVCFKDGSSVIVGLNFNYVASRNDPPLLSDIKSETFMQNMRVLSILSDYGNFDVFDKYGVEQYLSSFGMCVAKEYAGRKIGENLLKASKYLAKPCDLKLRHAYFTSNSSNKIAENLGYLTDVELSFKEIQRIDPSLKLDDIESSKATIRTWIFED
ncbi:uncharacterized protein LOC119079933 [Bradysia coprophila]|uniref:uncharacterized protein LOC119079933 n=1 Tax=Bradysia coprophila TaxID=38358 RepID=UPI00187D8F69|nr:uncharacterized protein LOC119079933 [Bradysia coprophila]